MDELTVVQFETSPHGSAHVSSLSEGAPYTVHGIALGADDVTVGQSGIKKLWPAEELKQAAETLKGTNLVVDHNNDATGVVGRVTKAGYKEETGVVYEAELFDEDLGQKVKNGLLEVSIRGYHADVDSLEEDDETDAKIVEDIQFDNLSIVPTGAAPSNTLQMGEHSELSAAQLSAFTDTLDEAALAEVEPGMWVQWDGNHGITISTEQDGEFEVDMYEEVDGEWRSTEKTTMVPTDDLSEWDVDEDNIGAAAEDKDEKDSEENRHNILRAGMMFFDSKNDSMLEIASVDGDKVLMSSDGEADDGSWYETAENIYMALADETYEYHDPDNEMPLITEGLKFYSTTNESVLEVLSVTDDMATMSSMNEDNSWEKPVEEIIGDLAEGELRVFHPDTKVEEMMAEVNIPMPDSAQLLYESVGKAMKAAKMLDLDEVHPHELDGNTWYMPGESHKEFEKAMKARMDKEEMAADAQYSRGDWVNWDTRNSTEIGKVVGSYTEGDDIPDIRGNRGMSPEGDEILYTLRLYKKRDGSYHPIEGKPIAHYEDSVRSAEEPSDVSESSVELGRSNVGQYDVEKDDWVQWYPSDTTEEHGFVLDVDDSGGDDEDAIVTIEVWTQNSDGEWETDGEEITKTMEQVEPWGNFPRKQEEFADAISGEDPRRAVKPSEENSSSEQLISEEVKSALKDKAEEHNEEHGDEDGKEVTYRMLKNVYERGMGAYQDSHREGMSAQQWSYARVNAFLYLVRNGNPENDQYTQDNDLLPEDHPKYNEDGDSEENAAGDMNAPTWEDGQMVRWQVNPAMMGKIVHVDDKKDIVMVEVMDSGDDGMESTGFTVTAGYSDLIPMDDEMAAATTRDVPTQDASPSHDSSSINGLLERFMEQAETSEPSLADFLEWMESEDLMVNRPEGAEEKYDSEKDLYDAHRGEPHRYTDAKEEQLAEGYNDYPKKAVENAQMALDAKEETGNPKDCGRETGWKRANQLANEETLTRTEVGKMSAFNRHRQHSEMDDEEGKADCGWMMWKAWGGDAGVDWASRKMEEIEAEAAMYDVPDEHKFRNKEDAVEKAQELGMEGAHQMDDRWMPGETHEEYMDNVASTSYGSSDSEDKEDEEMAAVDSLQDWEMHEPEYDGTTERDWNRPDMEDFDTDDMSEIADHFLVSSSGFPPENYGDLALPVVEPNGDLNVNALAAVKGGRGASAVDGLSDEMDETITEMMNELANEEFDRDWGMEEAQSGGIGGEIGRPTASKTVGGVKVLSGDDLQEGSKSEESDVDELTTYQITTMTSDIEEQVAELNEPVAVEQSEIDQLRDKADRFEEMSESLEALRERTDILDEVDRSQVEALAESDDPVVKESARFEELQSEAEQVAGVYAAQLSEHYDAFSKEELTDKFSIEELREKYEDQFGSVEDLASSDEAEPRSQDADEESLEQAADSTDDSTEELSESVEAKQEEIRNKIFR